MSILDGVAKRPLHFVVGVELLCDHFLDESNHQSLAIFSSLSTFLIPDFTYKRYIQPSIDGVVDLESPESYSLDVISSSHIIIIRPKFLSDGSGLGAFEGCQIPSYKFSRVQEFFSEIPIVFHLFIEDHASHFFRRQSEGFTSRNQSELSWIPIISQLVDAVGSHNSLMVWNMERPDHELKLFLDFIYGDSVSEDVIRLLAVTNTPAQFEPLTIHDAIRSAGLSLVDLDEWYSRDLDWINRHGLLHR